MFRPRIIPVLLLKNHGLVKSKAFKDFRYIGDPINAVKIYNDLKADELVFLDITATAEKRLISLALIKNIGFVNPFIVNEAQINYQKNIYEDYGLNEFYQNLCTNKKM